ncbi:hypothetical protein BH23THE1_BH23THE1_11320 [soil metagenome]
MTPQNVRFRSNSLSISSFLKLYIKVTQNLPRSILSFIIVVVSLRLAKSSKKVFYNIRIDYYDKLYLRIGNIGLSQCNGELRF